MIRHGIRHPDKMPKKLHDVDKRYIERVKGGAENDERKREDKDGF